MPHPARPYATLLIPRAAGTDPAVFLRGIADVLNHQDGGAARISTAHSAAAGKTIIVRVTREQHPMRGARITFELAPRPGREAPTLNSAVAVLSDIVLRALPLVEAQHVEWLQTGVALTPEEFVAAQSYISPRRAARREVSALPETDDSIDRIERNLAQLLQDEAQLFAAPLASPDPAPETEAPPEPEPRERRAATWLLTAMVAVVYWPMAAVLALIHARRGTDIRLSIHVLTLAGTGEVLLQAGLLDPLLRIAGQ
ncbi:hypothetical protein [Roseivivax sediminis]|uniref:Uncharacterized protein n=1 Tax=Roseivivax sediminis TaxID=936889 RepID=A0A1I1Y6L5_9RHOB|nr:hypothetical protein [Roseivivax sediminis]SFE14638.1 hypothetical protein SAMN04515678_106291 [Roseivivax sediminis]